jgi:hypothetical protein
VKALVHFGTRLATVNTSSENRFADCTHIRRVEQEVSFVWSGLTRPNFSQHSKMVCKDGPGNNL